MKITPGKLAGLKRVSTERGIIAAAAMDQRGSLQKSLAKDSNLALTASRYKIDIVKLSTAVCEELSKSAKGTTRKKSKTTKRKPK